MTDPPGPAGTGGDGTPRWVKIFGMIAAVAVVLVVILLVFGRGHGPGRHASPPPGGVTMPL
ncbi:MAG: hypothetical protein WD067_07770 [Gaiellaceae bacterium]